MRCYDAAIFDLRGYLNTGHWSAPAPWYRHPPDLRSQIEYLKSHIINTPLVWWPVCSITRNGSLPGSSGSISECPPKLCMRITRFEEACSRYGQMECSNFAKLALECCYYDQSILSGISRSFRGANPVNIFQAGRKASSVVNRILLIWADFCVKNVWFLQCSYGIIFNILWKPEQ